MNQSLVFIVSIIFDLYLWAVLLRIMLQAIRADYYNPLSQLVIKLTDFPLKLLYKLLPYRKGLDYAAIIFGFFIALIKVALLLLVLRLPISPINLLLFAALDFVQQLLSLYFYILIIVTIASWLIRGGYNPVIAILVKISDPILKPIAKFIPTIAGLDFSPLIALIIIKAIEILIMQLTLGY